MDSSEDEGYFSEPCFREPMRTAAAPSCMVHVQRHALHSDDDQRSERSVAREQLVLSHWRELLYALAARDAQPRLHEQPFSRHPPASALLLPSRSTTTSLPRQFTTTSLPRQCTRCRKRSWTKPAAKRTNASVISTSETSGWSRAWMSRLRSRVQLYFTVVMTGHDKCHVL